MTRALDTKPLHPYLGVEVRGLELGPGLGDDAVAALWQALDDHGLLVFRNHPLSDEDLLAVGMALGVPDGGVRRYRVEGQAAGARPSRWHSHGGMGGTQPAVLCLSALNECPEGGEIEFSSARAAWEALDEERKRAVSGLTAVHRFGAIAHGGGAGSDAGVRQPLVFTDSLTGRQSLFVGYHAVAIEGMPEEQAQPLLAELHAFATQERFVYHHQWRPSDLLLWDLCALLHHTLPVRHRSSRALHEVILASRAAAGRPSHGTRA